MLGVPIRCLLERERNPHRCPFLVGFAREYQARRGVPYETARYDNLWMSREVRDEQAASERRRDQHIPVLHELVHLALQQRSGTLGSNVLHRGNQPGCSKAIWPVEWLLSLELIDTLVAS